MAAKRIRGIELYGCIWQHENAIDVELDCIRRGGYWTDNTGTKRGNGLAAHVMAFAKIVWPWFKWHRWAVMLLNEICRPRHRLGVFGPASAGKSSPTGLVYLIFYFARPNNTTVLVSSTTRDELSLRIWGEITMFWREAKEQFDWLPGYLTDSKQLISTDGKDTEGRDLRNGIIARPVKIGNKWLIGSGTSPFVGIKNDYVYVAGDELGLMPQGIIDALANLMVNPECCFSGLGNLGDLDTPLANICEPAQGWDSLPDSTVSRAYDTRWQNGRAVQFIGTDSPNLDFPEGAEPYPKLIGRRFIKQCAHDYGVDTPLYNMFAAGKIPRGTMENRVITKGVCIKFHAFEEITWGHEPIQTLYALDVSYTAGHGDRTVGRPFAFGRDTDHQLRFAPLERPLVYTPNDRSTGSIEDQLATQTMAECKRLGIPPERVFYDGTGRSSFTAALMRLWSTAVNPVEFGGSASTRPNFIDRRYQDDVSAQRKQGDLLPCSEVFGKFVSELWFAVRYCIEAGQFRGLDEETAKEGYMRLWKLVAGNKMDVEPKPEMKLRLGRSPDAFDCLVVGLEGARRLGFKLGSLDAQQDKPKSNWLRRLGRELNELRESSALAEAA